jgi:predicted transcriptional regulator
MSECHQIKRPLFDNESLPPVKTMDLLLPTYCHVPFHYLSAQAKLSASRKKDMYRGESKCPQKRDLIVRMLSEKRSRQEIASEVGASFRAVNQYILRHDLAERGKTYVELAKEKSAEIHELHSKGFFQREIAERLGLNRWIVCEHLSGRIKRVR